MSSKSLNNLHEYEDAKSDAAKGIGNIVSIHQLRHILIHYVDNEYGNLDNKELVYQAVGGGFVIENENKLFMMPLYDKEENKINLSNDFKEPRVFLYEGKFIDANMASIEIPNYEGPFVFTDANYNKSIMHTWVDSSGERNYSPFTKEKYYEKFGDHPVNNIQKKRKSESISM